MLLILAGISISLVTGQNGVLTKARTAQLTYKVAGGKEQANMRAAGYVGEYTQKKYVGNDSSIGSMTVGEYVAGLIDGKEDGDYRYSINGNKISVIDKTTGQTLATGTIKDNGEILWDDTVADTGNTGNAGNSGNSGNSGNTNNQTNNNTTNTTNNNNTNTTTNTTNNNTTNTTNNNTTTSTENGANLYGTRVALGVTSSNGATIEDNWKIFYADASNVYLIYGGYYPTAAQTGITSGSTANIRIPPVTPVPSYESLNAGVNSDTNRLTLLRYLKNSSTYTIPSSMSSEGFNPTGGYKTWTDLATALSGGNTLAQGVTAIQGSPDLKMWVASWNSQQTSDSNKITDIRWTSNSANRGFYAVVDGDDEATLTFPATNKLYFPDINEEDEHGYWLASPGGSEGGLTGEGIVGIRADNGILSFVCPYVLGTQALRPVISIPRTYFNANNTENLTIN